MDDKVFAYMLAALACSAPILLTICIALVYAIHTQKETNRLLKSQLQCLKEDTWVSLRDKWFERIAETHYENEIEVEVKLIYPLLQFLGYTEDDFQVRVPVTIQIGRNKQRAEADWVIWNPVKAGKKQQQAAIIIEAKEPHQTLNNDVKSQARSYAFGLNAPKYILTNGRTLQIFRRGVENDTCIINCPVKEIATFWEAIERTMGPEYRLA